MKFIAWEDTINFKADFCNPENDIATSNEKALSPFYLKIALIENGLNAFLFSGGQLKIWDFLPVTKCLLIVVGKSVLVSPT